MHNSYSAEGRPFSAAVLLGAMLFTPALLAAELGDPIANIAVGDPNGSPPTTAGSHVDPNLSASPYAGVVSISTLHNNNTRTCSGVLISPTMILTAGHCLDIDANGVINVAASNITINFNHDNATSNAAGATQIVANSRMLHPDFTGFDNPVLNDDLAIIELSSPAPAGVPIYSLSSSVFNSPEHLYLAGYGARGNAANGYVNGSQNFWVKRIGENVTDDFDLDDEGSGSRELFRFDFDGPTSSTNTLNDGLTLGNDVEVTLAVGDSGGPSFVWDDSNNNGQLEQEELVLFGINTFTQAFSQGPNDFEAPDFGSQAGGMIVSGYYDWITDTAGVDQDGTWARTGGGLWNRATDWSGKTPDGIDSDAVFSANAPTGTALVRIGEGGIMLGSISVQNANRINLTDLSTNGIADPITFRTTRGQANISVTSDGLLSISNDVILQRDLVLDIEGSLSLSGGVSGAHSITSNEDGVLTFAGAMTHTGKTIINGGSYIVDGTHTGGARYEVWGDVTNSAGTTLSGTGSIDATIRIFKGVIVAGSANGDIGTLQINDAVFSGGTHYRWRIADDGADRLVVTEDIELNGGVFRFVRFNSFDPSVGTSWVALESLNGEITGTFDKVQGRLLGDKTIELSYTANQLIVTVVSTASASNLRTAAVPEPSSLCLMILGGAALMRRRRQ